MTAGTVDMVDWIFEFEEELIAPAVILATGALIAVFALGLVYRAIVFLAF